MVTAGAVVGELLIPDAAIVVVVMGTAATDTDCDAAADAYTSFPDWLAEIKHVPTALNVTTPAVMEHTVEELFAMTRVGASETSLSTLTVYVPPTTAFAGGVDRNVKVWEIFATVIVCVSDEAR